MPSSSRPPLDIYFLLSCISATIAIALYITAIANPGMTTYDFTYVNGVKKFSGHLDLGMFQMCRRGFKDAGLSDTCGVYTESFLFTAAYGNPLKICAIRDANNVYLNFCEKRQMVSALTIIALFSAFVAVVLCTKILMTKGYDSGLSIYIPAVASMFSGLSGIIAFAVWANFLVHARSNANFTVGPSYIVLIIAVILSFAAGVFGYIALLHKKSPGINGVFAKPRDVRKYSEKEPLRFKVLEKYNIPHDMLVPRNMLREGTNMAISLNPIGSSVP